MIIYDTIILPSWTSVTWLVSLFSWAWLVFGAWSFFTADLCGELKAFPLIFSSTFISYINLILTQLCKIICYVICSIYTLLCCNLNRNRHFSNHLRMILRVFFLWFQLRPGYWLPFYCSFIPTSIDESTSSYVESSCHLVKLIHSYHLMSWGYMALFKN